MLVLSRRKQESVVVGNANGFEHLLKVTVLDAKRGRVRLAFEIDNEVPIYRFEVFQRTHCNCECSNGVDVGL
jgi:carbon storage regulator CsrA